MYYIVYLLVNTENNRTYVGSTNNFIRRIRQHNGELVGGAKYTKANKGEGIWSRHCYIDNLDKHTALSLEKKIQIRSRKNRKLKMSPLDRRLHSFNEIINEYNIKEEKSLFLEL